MYSPRSLKPDVLKAELICRDGPLKLIFFYAGNYNHFILLSMIQRYYDFRTRYGNQVVRKRNIFFIIKLDLKIQKLWAAVTYTILQNTSQLSHKDDGNLIYL
jgi:hypothetical protein